MNNIKAVTAKCPFCDGKYTLDLDVEGVRVLNGQTIRGPCVLHTMPACWTFITLEPLEFAEHARKTHEANMVKDSTRN